jgi:hypothetical protein
MTGRDYLGDLAVKINSFEISMLPYLKMRTVPPLLVTQYYNGILVQANEIEK